MPTLQIFPLGMVPKKSPRQHQLIHLLLTHMVIQLMMAYISFDETVAMVACGSLGTLLSKCNIESALMLLPIFPGDFNFLGITLGNFIIIYIWH